MSERSRALERIQPHSHPARSILRFQGKRQLHWTIYSRAFIQERSVFFRQRSQADVFDFVALPIVQDWCCNDFQYGETSQGTDDHCQEGILPRVARWIFQYIETADPVYEFVIKLSMVERIEVARDFNTFWTRPRTIFNVKTGKLFLVDLAGSEKTCTEGKENS
ncbi:hypothetical protein SELMODRAFT_410457 [Selaginella moellendorffii]|uniref:Kinesin motor domain-containing protein n=1 Tax=Selaginella moellendorffii TaxID=88036 RepID=D8RET7_SELML|nr:hypothetical protein SELMODRAFT_410457 [Selaginella moellendorffii]